MIRVRRSGSLPHLFSAVSQEHQPPHPGQDEQDAEHPPEVAGLAEKDHSEQGGSGHPDPGPHRVGRPDREGLHRLGEQEEAQDQRHPRPEGRPKAGEPFGVLEPHRPAHLEGPRDDEYQPGHLKFLSKRLGAGEGRKRGRGGAVFTPVR